MALRIVFSNICFEEWIVSYCKRKSLQDIQLQFFEWVVTVNYRISLAFFKRFILKFIDIAVKSFVLVSFKLFESAIQKFLKFSSERRDRDRLERIENKVNYSFVSTLNGSCFLSLGLLLGHALLNALLLTCDVDYLLVNHFVHEVAYQLVFIGVSQHFGVQLVLVSYFQLVFETVAPERVFGQQLKGALETALQEVL